MADKRLISEIGQFQTDQLQDGHRITVENAESNLDPEATAESKAESKELKNEGNILMKQKKYLEELTNYTKAIQLDDQNVTYYCNRAVVYINLGNDALAIEDCHTALSIDPSYSNAYAWLGHVLMKQEKYHEALANFTKAIQLDDQNVRYYCYRANIHKMLGNHALAIADCQTALSINPWCSKAYNLLGNLLLHQKKYYEALANFTKAIQLDDHIAEYYCNRAQVHNMLGNHALAIKDCHTALSIDSSYIMAYAWLGHVLRKEEKYHEALANLTKAIQLDNHSVVCYISIGIIYENLNNHALAIENFQRALSIDPSCSGVHNFLGMIFCGQKDYHEALANITKAIQLNDQKVAYYHNRAYVHKMLGNHALAIKDCHTALSINPSCSKAYDLLGNIFLDQKEHHEALANYTNLIQLNDVIAHHYEAVHHSKFSNSVRTIKDSLTALSIDPSNSEAYTRLGLAFRNLGVRLRKDREETSREKRHPSTSLRGSAVTWGRMTSVARARDGPAGGICPTSLLHCAQQIEVWPSRAAIFSTFCRLRHQRR